MFDIIVPSLIVGAISLAIGGLVLLAVILTLVLADETRNYGQPRWRRRLAMVGFVVMAWLWTSVLAGTLFVLRAH